MRPATPRHLMLALEVIHNTLDTCFTGNPISINHGYYQLQWGHLTDRLPSSLESKGCRDSCPRSLSERAWCKARSLKLSGALERPALPASRSRRGSRSLDQSTPLQDEGRFAQKEISLIRTRLSINRRHSDQVANVDLETLDPHLQRFVAVMQRDYKLEGASLDAESKRELEELNRQLTEVQLSFETNVDEDERSFQVAPEQLQGMPDSFMKSHLAISGLVKLTTQTKDIIPIMTLCQDDAVRQEMLVTFLSRGHPQNNNVLMRMLQLRQKIALLLGFDTYAELSMTTESIQSAKDAATFIQATADSVKHAAASMEKKLAAIMQQIIPGQTQLQRWQISFAENMLSSQELQGLNEQALQPYFRLGQVRHGLRKYGWVRSVTD